MARRMRGEEGNALLVIIIIVVILAGAGAGLYFFAPDVLRGIPGISSLLPPEEEEAPAETEDQRITRLRTTNRELERQLKDQAEQMEEKDTALIEQQQETDRLREQVAKDVDERANKYVKILERMDPAAAADQIATLTPDIQAEILVRMKDKSAAAILEAMETRQASKITEEVMERLKEVRDAALAAAAAAE